MTQTVLLKRSATAAKVPVLSDLTLGEVGINTTDGKMYIRKGNGTGTDTIVQVGSTTSYTIQSASFTAVAGVPYFVDTASTAITVTLPVAPAANDTVTIVDFNLNSQVNNITVARNGKTINKLSEDLILDYNGISVQLVYYSGNWVLADSGAISNDGYITTTEYSATAAQTVFAVDYPSQNAVMVFVNGVQLSLADGDYTASTGTSVTLSAASTLNDRVKLVSFANIGNYPNVNIQEFIATAGQTTVPFQYYAAGGISALQVFKNGIQLSSSQYIATDGTSVVFNSALVLNDVIKLISVQGATAQGYATIVSPTFTGTPTAPTQALGDNSTKLATTAFLKNEFGASLASNGYQKLPSGLIIQWGQATASASVGTLVSVSFPIVFPTAVRSVQCTPLFGGNVSANGSTPTTSAFPLFATAASTAVYWMAIGY